MFFDQTIFDQLYVQRRQGLIISNFELLFSLEQLELHIIFIEEVLFLFLFDHLFVQSVSILDASYL
jgi:hypothetical protein